MIKLYHCTDARSFRALWALEEMGLDYELIWTPFPPRARAPGYLALNPLGTTPLLLDGATRMTESAAIPHYLATRHGPTPLAVAADEPAYGAYLNFLHMGEATLTFPQTIVLRYSLLEAPDRRLPQAAADYAQWFHSRLKAAAGLMGKDYVCAGRFTMADISVAYALMLASSLGLSERFPPKVAAYWAAMRQREGFARAKAAQDKAYAERPESLASELPSAIGA